MKKIISILSLMIIFISGLQNIVLGATNMGYTNIKKGVVINPEVEIFEEGKWYPMEAYYIYYRCPEGNFPAYSVSER